jgi:hypothetical protein
MVGILGGVDADGAGSGVTEAGGLGEVGLGDEAGSSSDCEGSVSMYLVGSKVTSRSTEMEFLPGQ